MTEASIRRASGLALAGTLRYNIRVRPANKDGRPQHRMLTGRAMPRVATVRVRPCACKHGQYSARTHSAPCPHAGTPCMVSLPPRTVPARHSCVCCGDAYCARSVLHPAHCTPQVILVRAHCVPHSCRPRNTSVYASKPPLDVSTTAKKQARTYCCNTIPLTQPAYGRAQIIAMHPTLPCPTRCADVYRHRSFQRPTPVHLLTTFPADVQRTCAIPYS